MPNHEPEPSDASTTQAAPDEMTERQLREVETYNARAVAEWRETVDLDHYSHDRYGPWNPYWRTMHYALDKYPPENSRVLAYGCGAGALGLRLAKFGYRVSAFDISDQLIRNATYLAEKYGLADRVDFSVQTAEALKYESGSFDAIVGMNILHHINLPKAVPEMQRVLRPGGTAVFKDSLQTPFRDRIRRSWFVRKILPLGVKNKRTGEKYRPTEDEIPLCGTDLQLMRDHFSKVKLERFHVLTLFAKVFGNRPMMEKSDWQMFRILPFMRRFGDNVVVILEK